MNLKEQVSNDLKQSMKDKNMVKLNILRVLKAEIERNEQTTNGKIELSDTDIIKQVKKMIEGIKQSTNDINEINILDNYLPKQLTIEEIKFIIEPWVKYEDKNQTLREIMQYFKTNHNGLYDGKVLSNLIKELV